jgi:hypothetical protein
LLHVVYFGNETALGFKGKNVAELFLREEIAVAKRDDSLEISEKPFFLKVRVKIE